MTLDFSTGTGVDMTELTDLERASGVIVGHAGQSVAPTGPPPETPLQALELAILPALCRPPCLVSFSGGMDSSFVLAVAARAARRHGLPAPVPCTWRFIDAPRAEESVWQDRVLQTLSLPDWVLLKADDDLDLVGPVAQRLFTRHGQLHPANMHLHLPIIERAAGGALLTGLGGDQILSGWRRAGPRSVRGRLRDVVPSRLRAGVREHRGDDAFPWLSRSASRQVVSGLLRERAAEPRHFDARVLWHTERRDLRTSAASLDLVAAGSDVLVVNPLMDQDFVIALARSYRRRPSPTRANLLAEIAADTLPAVATAPRAKAHFLEVFFRAPTRALVSGWSGAGLDPGLVDVAALRKIWSRWPVPGATAPLVQQVWLSDQGIERRPTAEPRGTRT